MGEHSGAARQALSFGPVAHAYDRARPSYPREAAAWLTGGTTGRVLELGAGTGKLTEQLLGLGHRVTATDPSEEMLRLLVARCPGAKPAMATAERIPLPPRSVDVVVSGQAFHWFDLDLALPEIARVLRPGGVLALAWNHRDERIPWVRRLGALIGTPPQATDPTEALVNSRLFGFVERHSFRFWQPMNRDSLRDLVRSRSHVAVMPQVERDIVLRKVDALYDEYGRGADGMLLPYVTEVFRSTVVPPAASEERAAGAGPGRSSAPVAGPDEVDTDALLIDFR